MITPDIQLRLSDDEVGRVGDVDVVAGPLYKEPSTTEHTRQSAKDLRADYKPTEWLVDGIIPAGGVVIIAGIPGCGKTWLSLAMALSVAAGDEWLEHFPCSQGSVLYVAEEEDPNSLLERLNLLYFGMGLSQADGDAIPIEFLVQKGMSLLKKELKKHIEEFQPSLVILDTFRRVHNLEENDSGNMAELARHIYEHTRAANPPCSIVLIHHLRKGSRTDSGENLERLRGSTDIAGAVDGVLEIGGAFPRLKVKHSKNKRGAAQEPFRAVGGAADPSSIRLSYEDDEIAAENEQDEGSNLVRQVLSDGPMNQQNFREACSAGGFGRDRLNKACDKMVEDGELSIDDGPRNSKMYSLVVDDADEPSTTITNILKFGDYYEEEREERERRKEIVS